MALACQSHQEGGTEREAQGEGTGRPGEWTRRIRRSRRKEGLCAGSALQVSSCSGPLGVARGASLRPHMSTCSCRGLSQVDGAGLPSLKVQGLRSGAEFQATVGSEPEAAWRDLGAPGSRLSSPHLAGEGRRGALGPPSWGTSWLCLSSSAAPHAGDCWTHLRSDGQALVKRPNSWPRLSSDPVLSVRLARSLGNSLAGVGHPAEQLPRRGGQPFTRSPRCPSSTPTLAVSCSFLEEFQWGVPTFCCPVTVRLAEPRGDGLA